jgi:hypothetical protein
VFHLRKPERNSTALCKGSAHFASRSTTTRIGGSAARATKGRRSAAFEEIAGLLEARVRQNDG